MVVECGVVVVDEADYGTAYAVYVGAVCGDVAWDDDDCGRSCSV